MQYQPLEPQRNLNETQVERHKLFLRAWVVDEIATEAKLLEIATAMEEVAGEVRENAARDAKTDND